MLSWKSGYYKTHKRYKNSRCTFYYLLTYLLLSTSKAYSLLQQVELAQVSSHSWSLLHQQSRHDSVVNCDVCVCVCVLMNQTYTAGESLCSCCSLKSGCDSRGYCNWLSWSESKALRGIWALSLCLLTYFSTSSTTSRTLFSLSLHLAEELL